MKVPNCQGMEQGREERKQERRAAKGAHLHAAARNTDGAPRLDAVEEELLHWVVVQRACRVLIGWW